MERQEYTKKVNNKELPPENDMMLIEKLVGITYTLSSPEFMARSALNGLGILRPEDMTSSQEYPSYEQEPRNQNNTPNPEDIDNDEAYSQSLSERAATVIRVLDDARAKIENDADANEWHEIKRVATDVQQIDDVYKKVDVVIELENAAYAFVQRPEINQNAKYTSVDPQAA